DRRCRTDPAMVAWTNFNIVSTPQNRRPMTDALVRRAAGVDTDQAHADLLSTILDALPSGILMLDVEGRVLFANRAECARVGNVERGPKARKVVTVIVTGTDSIELRERFRKELVWDGGRISDTFAVPRT